jgi:hypothetical protein
MPSLEKTLIKRIRGRGRGGVVSPPEFLDLGSRAAVDQVLSRLVKKNVLRRVSRGIYSYPEKSELLGEVAPAPGAVARAMARRGAQRLMPTGALAANQLGLTDQVTAKVEYLTDGASRRAMIKRLPVVLKHTSTRNLATADRVTGVVIQALRFLRQSKVTEEVILKLQERLSAADKEQLIRDIPLAPAWMGEVFRRVAMTSSPSARKSKA